MTGDLPEPDQGAAQQAYEAAARLYDEAAAELDRAAAHCRVAAGHFRGAEVPRGAAHAWAALGHLRRGGTPAGGTGSHPPPQGARLAVVAVGGLWLSLARIWSASLVQRNGWQR